MTSTPEHPAPTSRAPGRFLERFVGVVEMGDSRGRLLGFPTANLATDGGQPLPPDGVYAGWVDIVQGGSWPAAISLGRRPTFYEERNLRLLEAHLIDFEGDLYGRVIEVCFVERLRDQRRFPGVSDLIAQLRRDVDRARSLLRPDTASHPSRPAS